MHKQVLRHIHGNSFRHIHGQVLRYIHGQLYFHIRQKVNSHKMSCFQTPFFEAKINGLAIQNCNCQTWHLSPARRYRYLLAGQFTRLCA